MTRSLPAEEVYDALLDDECFAQLPARMNEAYGARSCTLHWWHGNHTRLIMAHSGYFSDEQMLNYAANFTQTDLWSLEAVQPSRANRVLNCDDIVPARAYEKSAFYNDWIRAMGDDTFHCIGIALRTRWGFGMVGLHRGRTQGPFTEDDVQALKGDVPALRRMLTMRGRLSEALKEASDAEAMLDGIGQAILLVSARGQLLHANAAAEDMLDGSAGLEVRQGLLRAASPRADRALKEAIAKAAVPAQPAASAVGIPRMEGEPLNLSLIPVPSATGARNVLITAHDTDRRDVTLKDRLRLLYGLSPGEACLAVMLAEGAAPADVAEERGVALGTVRVQIKAVAAKLGCHRQAEIICVVRSLPPLRATAGRG